MSTATFLVKNGLGPQRTAVLGSNDIEEPSLKGITMALCAKRGVDFQPSFMDEWVYTLDGKYLEKDSALKNKRRLIALELVFERKSGLLGGKGGYGSLLRNAAKTKIKLNDQSSNRTLNGRRIRDTENEKRLMEWLRRERRQREMVKKMGEENKGNSSKMVPEKVRRPPPSRLSNEYVEKEAVLENGNLRSSILQGISERKKVKTSDSFIPTSTSQREFKPETTQMQAEKPKPVIDHQVQKDSPSLLKDQEKKTIETVPIELEPQEKKPAFEPLDFKSFKSLEDVKKVNGDHLKNELTRLGLKCGGTPDQRAERLWIVIQSPLKLQDPKLQAAPLKKNF